MRRQWLIVEAGGFGDDIAQRVLGHVVGTAVTRAYQRSDFFEAKRRVLEDYDDPLRQLELVPTVGLRCHELF